MLLFFHFICILTSVTYSCSVRDGPLFSSSPHFCHHPHFCVPLSNCHPCTLNVYHLPVCSNFMSCCFRSTRIHFNFTLFCLLTWKDHNEMILKISYACNHVFKCKRFMSSCAVIYFLYRHSNPYVSKKFLKNTSFVDLLCTVWTYEVLCVTGKGFIGPSICEGLGSLLQF